MKTKLFLLIVFALSCSCILWAQEEKSEPQLYVVHEDYVKPEMAMEYEKAAKNLRSKMKEHGITDFRYLTFNSDEFVYGFVSPIENMAQMDQNPFATLEEKMGKEATAKMWAPMGKCYDTHKTYIVALHEELSFKPKTAMADGESQNYRQWQVYYVKPDKLEEAFAVAKQWKEMYMKHGAEFSYNMYTGVLGTDDPMFLVSTTAKNRADLDAKREKVMKSMGEDIKELQAKTLALTLKTEIREGMMRPDLAYWPKEAVANK